jgi:ACS family hexuronate transporter-like MFS transporter
MATGRFRFVIAGLLFTAGSINYMDRAALGIVAPLVRKELHLSPSQMGILFSSFFIGYAIFSFVGGTLADRLGPRKVFSWSMGLWSLVCGLTSAVSGFTQLLLCRLVFGCGEGPMNTTTNRSIMNWFPRNETGRTVGFTFAGQTFGNAISAPIVGLLAVAFGWRPAFLIIALFGFVWLGLWRWFMTDYPAQNRYVSKEEARMVQESRAQAVQAEGSEEVGPLSSYLFRPGVLAVGAGLFAVNYTLYVFLNWLPSYFTDALHLDMKTMSILAAIPWICAALGTVGGGIISDIMFKHMKDGFKARKVAVIVPLFMVAAILLSVSFVTQTVLAITLVASLLFCLQVAAPGIWALEHELVPGKHLGGVGGFIHLFANISGMIGPALTGYIVQYYGGYGGAFKVAAGVCAVGAATMVFFVRSRVTLKTRMVAAH